MKTGIIGGGITGLTIGCFLDNSTIVEKDHCTGGLCRSLEEQGFTFDYGGSHIIFSKDHEVMDFMIDSLKENIIKNRRNTKILFKGGFVKYPFENGLSDLALEDNYECLHGFIECLLKKSKNELPKPVNFKEWMYYTFGYGITEKYLLPYNEKIWNYKADMMDLEWVNGRIPEPPMEDIIKSSIGISTEGYLHQLFFYYPAIGGIQALIKNIEKQCKSDIITSFNASQVYERNGEWVISDGSKELQFERLVSTIPLQELLKIIDNVPQEVKDAINNLKFNSLITVMIGVDKPELNDLSWLYIPGLEDGLFNRISFPSNYSNHVVPEEKSSVLAEITCTMGDDIWQMGDEEIIKRTIEDLYKLGIIDKKDVCYTSVGRSKYAYVIYDLEYSNNMSIIRQYFDEIGIYLCGRFSEFKYLNMDGCIRSGIETAKRLNLDV